MNRLNLAAHGLALGVLLAAGAQASTWTGGNGAWTSDSNPGWNGTGVPTTSGATATKTDNTTASITASGQTVGTFSVSGSSQATFGWTGGTITMDQDGAGAGFATISNESSSTLARVSISATGLVSLGDDLLISNSGGSTSASGSISLSGVISGTGNVTFSNVSNSSTAGFISLGTAANTFTGNVKIEKGAVIYGATTGLGNAANAVTLGSTGNSATLLYSSNNNTSAYNFTVAATTGTNVLGSNSTSSASNTTFSGTLLLNGGLSISSVKAAGADVRFTGVISGAGGITTTGTGEVQFGDGTASLTHTYAGNTALSGTSSLVLADNAKLTFYIGANGVNNKISGAGTNVLTLDGDFIFDLSGAATNGSWTIVDVGTVNESFSSTFLVSGFSESGNVWTLVNGGTTYTFTEATGILTASSIPEPSTYAVLLGGAGLALAVVRRRRG